MNSTLLELVFIALGVPFGFIFAYLNRVRGGDLKSYPMWGRHKKFLSILAMGFLSCLLLSAKFLLVWGDDSYLILAGLCVLLVLGDFLLLKPSWGEIFVHLLDTYHKSYARFVKPLTNKLVGYAYDSNIAQNDVLELFWKEKAWVVRFGLYGSLSAGVYCIAAQSFIPLILWGLGSLWVGFFYARPEYLKRSDPGSYSERYTGFYMGVIRCLSAAT